MARSTNNLVKEIVGHFNYLDQTRSKMEYLFQDGAIVKRDIELVYGGLFLDAVTTFERFLEELFIGIIVGRLIHPSSKTKPRILVKSDVIAFDLVHGGNNYLDWLPYYHTAKRAKAFFRAGHPFNDLDNNDMKKLERMSYIRNAIAHKSKFSNNKFSDKVISGLTLTPRERTPIGFLRSIFAIAPIQTQYEGIISDMAMIAHKLAN